MLTQVEIINDRGLSLVLNPADASSGYAVKEILGLDPVKATVVSSSFATMDGAYYQSSRRDVRNITMKLGLVPNYLDSSVQSLRNKLFGHIQPKSLITLRFSLDKVYEIQGVVESTESNLFTKEPEVYISILCMNPDFVAQPLKTIQDTRDKIVSPGVEFSYDGTIDTGVIMEIKITQSISGFIIYHTLPNGEVRQFVFEKEITIAPGGFLDIRINSNRGEKEVSQWDNGWKSILYAMDPTSAWLELQPGINKIRLAALSTNRNYPWSLTYYDKYGGL